MSNRNYIVSGNCPNCTGVTTVRVADADMRRYDAGAFVQDAFPYLTDAEREAVFLSGICAQCWDELFPDED